MRRSELEIRGREELEALIRRVQICRVGFSENGNPYIVPVNFGYRDNCIYFHCAPEGKKIEIIGRNPRVCFEMDTDYELIKAEEPPCRWSARYRSIIGFGTAAVVEDPPQKAEALNVITGHYGAEPYDFSADELEKVKVVRITIESISGKQAGY